MKLRRVASRLHGGNGDDTDKAEIKTMMEAVQNRAIDVLQGLRVKLEQLIQALHRKENMSSVIFKDSEDKSSQKQEVTTATKELTEAEKQSTCGKFVHMVQDERLHLTGDQQIAIARGIIQMLKTPNLSDSSLGATYTHLNQKEDCREGDVNRGHRDSEHDSGYQECRQHRNGSDASGKEGHEGAEETGQQADAEENRDRARIG